MFHSLIRTLEEIQKEPCRWVKQPVSCFLCFGRVNANVPCHANLKNDIAGGIWKQIFRKLQYNYLLCREHCVHLAQRGRNELCSHGSLQAGAALKASLCAVCADQVCGVWVFPSLALVPSLCALVPQQTDVQAARRPCGGSLRSEPATASSSVSPCEYVLSWLCPLGRVKDFPLGVQPMGGLKVPKSVGSGCTASRFFILVPCFLHAVLPTLIFPFHFKWRTYW